MGTFGASARYDEEPMGTITTSALMRCVPITMVYSAPCPTSPSASSGATLPRIRYSLEVMISGHHLGPWCGLPPTGRPVRFPLCGVFTFDGEDRLAGEKIYYDRATILRQLGVFHEPDGVVGRIEAVVMHPLTIAQALGRMILHHRTS